MKERFVRRIKKFFSVSVINALESIGYTQRNPRHPPTNIEVLVGGLPRHVLRDLVKILEKRK